jgi:hypothetical protein
MQAFKRKGVILYGQRRSGVPNSDTYFWQNQGPFGPSTDIVNVGTTGFSINGGRRNIGYVGRSSAMSQSGTPFRGVHAKGNGGICGRYPVGQPSMNAGNTFTEGIQFKYIKPSVLSTKGMLERKYKWIHNGTYPNYWVQPVYGNNSLSDNASQGVYLRNLAVANMLVTDTNNPEKYDGKCICGPGATTGNSVSASTGGIVKNTYNRNVIETVRGYTKSLYTPPDSSEHTLQIQRRCINQAGHLKPFPFAVNNGGSINSINTKLLSPIRTVYYNSPPEWYLQQNLNCSGGGTVN